VIDSITRLLDYSMLFGSTVEQVQDWGEERVLQAGWLHLPAELDDCQEVQNSEDYPAPGQALPSVVSASLQVEHSQRCTVFQLREPSVGDSQHLIALFVMLELVVAVLEEVEEFGFAADVLHEMDTVVIVRDGVLFSMDC
jgi:hypothetical protein